MCMKPDKDVGREKMERWAAERDERGEERPNQPALNTHPRETGTADDHDLDRSVERFEALLGR